MMECFVRSPSHCCTSSDPPPCSIQAPSLPNAVHSLLCSWTTRKYKLVIQSNMRRLTHTRAHIFSSTTFSHPHTHIHTLLQQGCWVEPKWMQEGQNGRRAGLCNASLPALDKIYTSLRPTRPIPISVCFSNHIESLSRR